MFITQKLHFIRACVDFAMGKLAELCHSQYMVKMSVGQHYGSHAYIHVLQGSENVGAVIRGVKDDGFFWLAFAFVSVYKIAVSGYAAQDHAA